jgi:hypothetical protein
VYIYVLIFWERSIIIVVMCVRESSGDMWFKRRGEYG